MIAFFVVLIFFPSSTYAQSDAEKKEGISFESEVGVNFKGDVFASQYVFLKAKKIGGLSRLFWEKGHTAKGDFAIGPRFAKKNFEAELFFGGTTDREVMVAGLLSKGKLEYWGDLKLPTKKHREKSFEQRISFRLWADRNVSFRSDNRWKGKELEYWSVGLNFDQRFNSRTVGSVFPFYDPKNKALGVSLRLIY